MTDNEIKEFGIDYAIMHNNEVYNLDEEGILELVAKAHSDGIRKGMDLVLNTLDRKKDIVSEAISTAVLDVLQKDR